REVALEPGSLLIADAHGPLALAGIMGGEASAVGEGTGEVLLEAAFFSPAALAGQARRYGLHTDSSQRFERGVDPELAPLAMERATALLLEICGGEAGPVVEVLSREHLPRREPIPFRPARAEALLGVSLDAEALAAGLGRLGLAVDRGEPARWRVTPPSHRFDLGLEEDLVEEAARLHGYQRLPQALPRVPLELPPAPEGRLDPERVRALLVERGYHEAVTYSFVDPELLARLDPERRPLALANPIAADLAVMRTTLWAGLLQALARNRKRQQERVRLFELGRRYLPAPPGEEPPEDGAPVTEEAVVAAVAWGPVWPEQWGLEARPVDLFDLKGDLEALLALTGRPEAYRFVAREHPALHPGRSAALLAPEGEVAGWLGELHPRLVEALELGQAPQLLELRLADLEPVALPRYRAPSRFPAVRRDLAVVVPEEVPAGAVAEAVREAAGEVLQELRLFDVYRGKGVESGKKSLAMGLTLQDFSRTLTDQEVDAVVGRVVEALGRRFQAKLRANLGASERK
ncbi:MAG: phenylalanine--tRNA ligase subunit beta, partial [Gammaproteobacteria bacterium]